MISARSLQALTAAMLLLGTIDCGAQNQEEKQTVDDTFGPLFEEALTAFGPSYREIRSEIVGLEDNEVVALADKRRHPSWEVRLQAEIFAGWRREADRYGFIRRVADGTEPSLEGDKYLTGRPPVGLAAEALTRQGERYLPAVLEILYKEPDLLSDYAFSVCTQAILTWKARQAVPVYRALLLNPDLDPTYRELSIQPLLALEAEGRYEDFLAVYEEESNPLELRATALASLGAVDAARALSLLEEVLADPETETRLRSAAAFGIGETQQTSAIDLLVSQYTLAVEPELKEGILQALGALEDPTAIAPLEQIRATETDPAFLELIDELLGDLEE